MRDRRRWRLAHRKNGSAGGRHGPSCGRRGCCRPSNHRQRDRGGPRRRLGSGRSRMRHTRRRTLRLRGRRAPGSRRSRCPRRSDLARCRRCLRLLGLGSLRPGELFGTDLGFRGRPGCLGRIHSLRGHPGNGVEVGPQAHRQHRHEPQRRGQLRAPLAGTLRRHPPRGGEILGDRRCFLRKTSRRRCIRLECRDFRLGAEFCLAAVAALGAVGVDRLADAAQPEIEGRRARRARLVADLVVVPARETFQRSHSCRF